VLNLLQFCNSPGSVRWLAILHFVFNEKWSLCFAVLPVPLRNDLIGLRQTL
jgi:hypothetical protein